MDRPGLLDADLSLAPLYKFYSESYGGEMRFDETCGILIYWAYQKGLLKPGYLS